MIILKIYHKGLLIEIPGVTPFRTPAEVDITNIGASLVVSHLRLQDISNYEIVAGEKQTNHITPKEPKIDHIQKEKTDEQLERINNLEKLLEKLIEKIPSNTSNNSEQINKKLDVIEGLIQSKSSEKIYVAKTIEERTKKEPVVDEEIFIPDVDIGKMKISGGSSKTTTKQNKLDIDSAADLLSKIGK